MTASTEPRESPIFVVGPSRSGTTMMRLLLNKHGRVWVAGETHYFDDLRPRFPGRDHAPLTPAEAKACQDYFLAIDHKPYGRGGNPERAPRVTRDELQDQAGHLGAGTDAYFHAYCTLLARFNGKVRWGEKTPRHVFRIAEMLAVWPAAQIVCMVRDPRAVVSSYRYWKLKAEADGDQKLETARDAGFEADEERARRSYNAAVVSLLWRSAMRASQEARRRFGEQTIRIQQYEPILREPEAELRLLTDWLSLDYEEQMLDVPILNSSFGLRGQTGISQEPLERWRTNLPPEETAIVQSCCGRLMDELGYERVPVAAPRYRIALAWAAVPVGFGRAFVVNRRRMGNVRAYLWRRLRLAASRGRSPSTGDGPR